MIVKVHSHANGQTEVFGHTGQHVPEFQGPLKSTLEKLKAKQVQFELYEMYEGKWSRVLDGARSGWWRFHQHYDRDGYCDNPARGY